MRHIPFYHFGLEGEREQSVSQQITEAGSGCRLLRDVWVGWEFDHPHFLPRLVLRVEAYPVAGVVTPLVVPVPVVAGHAQGVAGLQIDLVLVAGLMGHHRLLLVVVLPSEVPDVVEGLEVGRPVHETAKHTDCIMTGFVESLFGLDSNWNGWKTVF